MSDIWEKLHVLVSRCHASCNHWRQRARKICRRIGSPDLGGLFEIWEDAASGALDPRLYDDLGTKRPVLGPRKGNVQVRWFVISPIPVGMPKADLDKAVRERFAAFDGTHHIIDQSRHPGMHETHSIDVICLLQGDASLILEEGETRLKPGQVVIQRGTNHAWQVHGGPALFLAVLIDESRFSSLGSVSGERLAVLSRRDELPLPFIFLRFARARQRARRYRFLFRILARVWWWQRAMGSGASRFVDQGPSSRKSLVEHSTRLAELQIRPARSNL
jgi:hypothetical protein